MLHSQANIPMLFPQPWHVNIYAMNTINQGAPSGSFEFYFLACTAYWGAVAQEKNMHKRLVGETNKMNKSSFTPLTNTPRVLHAQILHTCSKNPLLCPFPTYDVVIELTQVYCVAFFHFTVEICHRMAPFLIGLLADVMPTFAICFGCDSKGTYNTRFYEQFYELVGPTSPKINIIGQNIIFAREVIIPKKGFSHSSLLNYWNLVPLRRYVRQCVGETATI